MQRIDDRQAVLNLARAIFGQGSRGGNEASVMELLVAMSERDDASKRHEREFVRRPAEKQVAKTG